MKWWWACAVVILFLSGAAVFAFPLPSLVIVVVDLAHVAVGLVFTIAGVVLLRRLPAADTRVGRAGWVMMGIAAACGIGLLVTGGSRRYQPLLYGHIASSIAGVGLLCSEALRARIPGVMARLATVSTALLLLSSGAWWAREVQWQRAYVIQNPLMPPANMDAEGDGAAGPFFPSSAQTTHGGLIPSKFFMESESCRPCHAEIYQQWESSMHHFSSFNNQWYRKSIEYQQEVAGVKSTKWCAGCHDPALLFSGKFDTPIREQVNTPEAQAGLGCVMCHSLTRIKSTMGQGDYNIEYPELHDLATSSNRLVRAVHDFAVKLNPEPHRRAFLKPFLRQQPSEFCSSCHKVHLDVPVNSYRWMRGFNDYDNWQASGVSGQGARAFYYPEKSQNCVDCHMPLADSKEFGAHGGKIHTHRFAAANSALPFVNQDAAQLQAVEAFLKDKIVSVDIFALSQARPLRSGGEVRGADLMTTFAVGEEADVSVRSETAGTAVPVTAPLNYVSGGVRRGDDVRVDVVVRTRKVGHFFPAGTVDAFDVWIELKATDSAGRVLFWSGRVDNDGQGPIERGAHMYRSVLVDAAGNWINKRNAFAARAAVYVRLIPPGAADVAHYRLHVPEDAGGEIHLEAKLHYRKFLWWNTQFAFAGQRDPTEAKPDVTPHYDNGRWLFTGDTGTVSGKLKSIPNLPAIAVASDRVSLQVLPRNAPAPEARAELRAQDWQRWNDYGIGLLLQGDLKGAEAAFQKVTEIDANNPDGWVNIGRARLAEGDLPGARKALEKALALRPQLARALFFYGRALRSEGEYDKALDHMRRVLLQYPRDRVVRNEAGRILFLQKKYAEAIREFEQTLAVDPEDLQAHYNLMLCYTGLGESQRADAHRARYLRFKADESAQTITGPYRLKYPEDNNERQAIHEHVSVPLAAAASGEKKEVARRRVSE